MIRKNKLSKTGIFRSHPAFYLASKAGILSAASIFFWQMFTHTGIKMIHTLETVGIIIDPTTFGELFQYPVYAAIGLCTWALIIIALAATPIILNSRLFSYRKNIPAIHPGN
ncbi:hypothetical protein [Methanohalophilus portucalensis]|uniref:Uncharacterized protein n=4 Tax=Methanohalophilus portucalensis TaxID=39664 RepID=A0A1X7P0N7_9EURY|nr:hypothetical protein [Methanohalophilus portucalensis]ATU08044.1 hypothetical protein BKM01_04185 [Methanohalophilus portucalensis]RNI12234.1 hypothetical protein EFE41_03765 [Methanohalophilus portucalensis FDF-1]SMH43252.1 hypothetical protein SAMN06264941_1927 [Methanohalophilus portucalensis FDF-1]